LLKENKIIFFQLRLKELFKSFQELLLFKILRKGEFTYYGYFQFKLVQFIYFFEKVFIISFIFIKENCLFKVDYQ
jgi:hypothetical protein